MSGTRNWRGVMSDLIERLRGNPRWATTDEQRQAADRIEKLEELVNEQEAHIEAQNGLLDVLTEKNIDASLRENEELGKILANLERR